ncbi:MAG: PRC-barrel domain-containing protein [Thermoanaerobacterales bacterium]|nr:PRC-barrel domain-containing protein [Bacillota bacterium]MDI6906945.1 PRC-barrel domain-containing protein [Thermoanaerobacterales bacterium]
MRKSREIIGLPVLSISEVATLGSAKGLLVNPATGTVDFVAVDRDGGFRECLVVPFTSLEGIGPDALTVAGGEAARTLSSVPEALNLLDRQVRLIDTRVMTRKGQITGVISEYAVDEESGRLMGLEVVLSGQGNPAGVVPAANVVTYGRDLVVVDQDLDSILVSGFDNLEAGPQPSPSEAPKVSDPLQYFEQQQKQLLLGRKVAQRITADDGTVIAEAGDTVTQEIIDQAVKYDKYVDLALYTGV